MEIYLQDRNISDYEKHIKFLRDLQDLRSNGVAHRKGRSYKKFTKEFSIQEDNLIKTFDDILENSIEFIEFLVDNVS